MDYFIQLILAIPAEKLAVVLHLLSYLEDPFIKDVLKSVLITAAFENNLSELEMMEDPITLEYKRCHQICASIWKEKTKGSLSEDDRLPLVSNLMAVKNKKNSSVFLEKVSVLIDLCYNHSAAYSANALTSFYGALIANNQTVEESKPDFQLAFSAIQEKFLSESTDTYQSKIQRAQAVMDVYVSISRKDIIERINLLCKLDDELKLVLPALKALLESELRNCRKKSETVDASILMPLLDSEQKETLQNKFYEVSETAGKILSFYYMFLSLRESIYDGGKNVSERLEAFHKKFLAKSQQIGLVGQDNVDNTVKDFLERVVFILEDNKNLLLPFPAKTNWGSGIADFVGYGAARVYGICMFGRGVVRVKTSTLAEVNVTAEGTYKKEH